MKGRFGRLRLGALWVIFEPLAHMVVLGTIIALRARVTYGDDFLVFLLVGLAPFLLFKNIALKIMGSVEANKALFSYKQIQPADAFVARAIVEFCISAITFILLYVGLTWAGHETAIHNPIRWLLILFIGISFSFALGILFAIIADAAPELKVVLSLSFMPLYLLSGVIYPISRLPNELIGYLLWNPYLHIIDLIRESTFKYYRIQPGVSLIFAVKSTIVISFISYAFYRVRRFKLMAL